MDKKKIPRITPITVNGNQYYVIGKTRIKITEHFQENGPSVVALLENMITYASKSA